MQIKLVRPSTTEEKHTKTTLDVVELTERLVASWRVPPFQRDLKINAKVLAVAEEVRLNGGVLPGILTVGVFDGVTYIVDGQHRVAAWRQTGLQYGYADVRTHWFATMGEMANEFVRLNSSLVRLRPDDIMRGMEASTPPLQKLRKRCAFIGYDMIRRGDKAPVLSMSAFVRLWAASKMEVPAAKSAVEALVILADDKETDDAIDFATICYEAWRREPTYGRLWASLNMTLCAWLYRRTVLGERSTASRAGRVTKEDYRKWLMALSADAQYLDWLVGRNNTDRDRSPAFNRIKTIFQRRYLQDRNAQIKLVQPPWSPNSGKHTR